jgi:HK97 family phage portal protein
MNLAFWKRGEKRVSLENPAVSLADPRAYSVLFGDFTSSSGEEVTAMKALGVPAVWRAINFISSTIASLPLQVFKKTADGRESADSDPVYDLLHEQINSDQMTSFRWRKDMMQAVLIGGGRHFTFIERDVGNRPTNLWPLDPSRTTVERRNGKKLYRYRENGREIVYQSPEIIDIAWMMDSDGVRHMDPLAIHRDSFGLAIALNKYAGKFFQNGGVPLLALNGPVTSPGAAVRAKEDLTSAIQKANAEQKNFLVIPTGHELKPIGVDPEKSQLEESRRLQVLEVGRIYDLPPAFLMDLEFGTFSNTEQQDLNFVKHTLRQWLELIEAEVNVKLFASPRSNRYAEFNVDGLLRGDFKSRMEAYQAGIQNAVLMPNEAREMENRVSAKGGDSLFINGALRPISEPYAPKQSSAPTPAPDPASAPQDNKEPPK